MSRAIQPLANTDVICRQIEASLCVDRVRTLNEDYQNASADLVQSVLWEAARFAHEQLEPLNDAGDRAGCMLDGGRVRTAPGHRAAWRAFAEGGWLSLDAPPAYGGQGLPLSLALAAQEVFDRSCPAFGMMPVPIRAGARLIDSFADEKTKADWLPRLLSGERCTTICISEAEAGSDVRRIRTRATRNDDGSWRITGEKMWISFGDQDLTDGIGHCVLAQTGQSQGLSLFLVPDHVGEERNAIVVRRIEEKLGLHMSPTCALGFEGARGVLLGEEGRGLQQMFVMITNMRLSVGVQGLAIASGACDLAFAYAEERRQGGSGASAIPIAQHADVQRMLMSMAARVETLRGLGLTIANQADIARHGPDADEAAEADAFVQWMLPIFKTLGAETAFYVASEAVQVFGGAGYTRDWPLEQALRDARVLSIFEGATGIQGLDLLHRRLWRDRGRGLEAFVRLAERDLEAADAARVASAAKTLDLLKAAANHLSAAAHSPREAEAGATAFLTLAGHAATGWIAARLVALSGDDPAARRLRAAASYWLAELEAEAPAAYARAIRGAACLEGFDDARAGAR